MLDDLVKPVAAPESLPTSMIASNLALRAARDAVDGHQVWELDPADVVDDRLTDRLDAADIADLRTSIEANGQAVPILVRRDPEKAGRYRLIYGRRRLEAVRVSESVKMVRALVANLDDGDALQAQSPRTRPAAISASSSVRCSPESSSKVASATSRTSPIS